MKTITVRPITMATPIQVVAPSRKHPLRVVIKRSKWLRGKGSLGSMLLHPVSKRMCCLGFDALALGFKKEHILDRSTPATACAMVPGLAINGTSTKTCDKMMDVNDDVDLTDRERERKLKALAKRINRRFVFKD